MSNIQVNVKLDKAKLVEVLKPEILKDVKTISTISISTLTTKHTLKPSVGVNRTYASPDSYTPPSTLTDWFVCVHVANIDIENNESIMVKIEVDYGDGIVSSVEFGFGGLTETWRALDYVDMCDLLPPSDDTARSIQTIRAYANSNLASSNAVVEVILGIRYLTITVS
jgi:hypothetical protein